MWVNWKRFSFGAFLLASLSLLLVGCGDFSGSQTSQKTISGVVSDANTGLPLSNAKVTAYAIDANGVLSTTPLSSPETVQSNNRGRYTLHIPATYTGSVMLKATKTASPLAKLAKVVFDTPATDTSLQAAVPSSWINNPTIPPVMISFATDMVVKYMQTNNPGGSAFSADSIQKATIVLETFFGSNFAQTPPPNSSSDSNTSKQQQDLIVSIQAINSFAVTEADVIGVVAALIQPSGLGDTATQIKQGIADAITALSAQGVLPAEYTVSPLINTAISNAQFTQVTVDLTDAVPPTAPSGLSVSSFTAKSVTLIWTASQDANLDGYIVYRTDSSGIAVPVGQVPTTLTSFNDFTVAPSSQYNYYVAAFDKARNMSAGSNVVGVTTPDAPDTTPPSAPVGLICFGFSQTQINLQWVQATKVTLDGKVIPATSYIVYRNSQYLATTNEPDYIDRDVTASTTYTYYVKAADANNDQSAASQLLTVRTPATVVNAPDSPTNVANLAPEYNSLTITWSASDTAGVSYYNVYRDGQLLASGLTGLQYVDGSVTPNTSYSYSVTAVTIGSGGKVLESVAAPLTPNPTTLADPYAVDNTAPSVPTNLAVVSSSSNSVALLWTASSKPTGDNLVGGYDVLRKDPNNNAFVKIATVAQPGYTDTTVAENSSYSYVVQSFSSSGVRSNASASATVTTSGKPDLTDTTPPNPPTGLVLATPATSTTVVVSWNVSTEADLGGYRVFRDGSQIADVAKAQNFSDVSVSGGTTYSYTVKAYDTNGNVSGASSPLAVTTPAAIPNTYSISGSITLNGAGLSVVSVTVVNLSDSTQTQTAVTDVNGNYFAGALPPGTYSITPVVTGFTVFTPGSRVLTVSNANVAGQDFTAVQTGSLVSGADFPDGTIIGGITYPAGTVLNGVSYPTGVTVLNGVAYPTAVVIGGVTYPTGTVIGGVSYPAGTIVGGIAFPTSALSAGFSMPTGTVINGVVYPTGPITAGFGYPSGVVYAGVTYPTGIVKGGVLYPTAGVVGGVSFPTGSTTGTVSYPSGGIVTGVTYPQGTLIGGITYPTGTTINGIYYPTATVIGGITYPSGLVIGGVTYPTGVVIGGVSYPAGTVVGGVTFPSGVATAGYTVPTGVMIGGVVYPTGTVSGGVITPSGTAIGSISYPTGVVIGGALYPTGSMSAGVLYPTGGVSGAVNYPAGSLIGGITYPTGKVINGVYYPTATVIGGVTTPSGMVIGGTTYPNGVVIAGVTYPAGTVVGGVAFPVGMLTTGFTAPAGTVGAGVSFPAGSVLGGITYPTGNVINGVYYPTATVVGGVTYPTGIVVGGTTYPNGVVIGGVSYPSGTVVGGVALPVGVTSAGITTPSGSVTSSGTYPAGSLIGGITYPTGTTINGVFYPTATVIGGVTTPSGIVIGGTTYPNGVVIGGVSYPAGTVVGGVALPVGVSSAGITVPNGAVTGLVSYPAGSLVGGITYPTGTTINGVYYPTATVIGGVTYPTGSVSGGTTYPNGVVIGGVSYPAGTVVGGVALPVGTVATAVTTPDGSASGGLTYPDGSIIGGISYPTGTTINGVYYPTATVIGGVTYPTGNVVGGVVYPQGVVIGGVTYPAGTVVGGVALPAGALSTDFAAPGGTIINGVLYPNGTVSGGIITPGGSAIGYVTAPTGTSIAGAIYPSGFVAGGIDFPVGTTTAGLGYPGGGLIGGLNTPGNSISVNLGLYYRVSGKVINSATLEGLSGVTMDIAGPQGTLKDSAGTSASLTTDAMGNYTFYVNISGSGSNYIVAPDSSALSIYTFDNPSASLTLQNADVSLPNFVATPK